MGESGKVFRIRKEIIDRFSDCEIVIKTEKGWMLRNQ